MTLEDLGFNEELENYRRNQNLDVLAIGRVISEHKERYGIKTTEGEFDGELLGNLRYSAEKRSDLPAVGDWVTLSQYDDDKVLIHSVFPRKTILERKTVGEQSEKQIIACNVDYAFILQAVDRDFNINRMERYLTLCHASHIDPIIVLNKIDLITASGLTQRISSLQARIKNVPFIPLSNASGVGIETLQNCIYPGKTYCLLGSSGVGKSTLINVLTGQKLMLTKNISESSQKGRHVTTHRELVVLENGGILIDNPGMREVGITDSTVGLEATFEHILELSQQCRFKDCTHTVEKDCAIISAVESGVIHATSYKNYLKMEREKDHFDSSIVEKRKKDKDFGKMVKHVKKNRKSNKY